MAKMEDIQSLEQAELAQELAVPGAVGKLFRSCKIGSEEERINEILALIGKLDPTQQTQVLAAPGVVLDLAQEIKVAGIFPLIKKLDPAQQTEVLNSESAVCALIKAGQRQEILALIEKLDPAQQTEVLENRFIKNLMAYQERTSSAKKMQEVYTADTKSDPGRPATHLSLHDVAQKNMG